MPAIGTPEVDSAGMARPRHWALGSGKRAGHHPDMDRLAARLTLLEAVMRYRERDEQGALKCLGQLADCPIKEMSDLLCPEFLPQGATGHKDTWDGKSPVHSSGALPHQPCHRPDGPRLTRNQRTVLQHVAGGASNGQIGRRMGISQDTVKWHLKQIFRRLGVSNRCAAVTAARARGVL